MRASKRRFMASYDELMERAYGREEERLLRHPKSAQQLLDRYYGYEPEQKDAKQCEPRCAVHVSCDDATHLLGQRRRPTQSYRASPPAPAFAPAPAAAPVQADESRQHMTSPSIARAPAQTPTPPVAPLQSAAAPAVANRPEETSVDNPVNRYEVNPSHRTASDDDFIADMQSILNGTGVYDQGTRKIVPKHALKEHPGETATRQAAPNGPGGDVQNGQAIFDRIAKSMRHAGAYDLGDVELENRFADFDRMSDLKGQAKNKTRSNGKAGQPASGGAPTRAENPAPVDSSDFIEDLAAIQKQTIGAAEASRRQSIGIAEAMKPDLAGQSSLAARHSTPFYATGEHVLAGGDLYKDQLLVGQSPGVAFSYGQIVAMADLFETVDQMMGEDVAMLAAVRTLVQRETDGGSVDSSQWGKATRGRYMKLAEDNYEHFAPNLLFRHERFSRSLQNRNHRAAWESHHERAIREAQRMALDPAVARSSYIPVWPLIVNAFGDHFLTDAFAAGHIVNKQAIGELFKSRFYDATSLNSAGKSFFENVAKAAWKGKVAARFQKLETYDAHDAWWNVVGWHPDIKNAERFGEVLKAAAVKAPDKIANLAVKAVHDKLNERGVEVVNDAGHGPWRLTGDGHLTAQTLAIMQTAVRESAGHITEDSIFASNIALANYFARVWKYVPKLTAASAETVKGLVESYILPASQELVGKAAEIIGSEVETLIEELIDAKALQEI